MRLDIYVNYRGNCEEAFRFYERHLGGRITGIARHGDQPNPNIRPTGRTRSFTGESRSARRSSWVPTSQRPTPCAAPTSRSLDSEYDAERVYALLTDGGEIFMKMEKTPFANRFAMLRDKFGTSWMLLQQPQSM
jgi:PhnB protein